VWFGEERHVQAISATTAYLMSSMLSDVVSSGTATRARTAGFKLPAGGKTGTTDDYADAWFIGYTPRLLTGVWFGLDQPAPIMRDGFGGTIAVPAWARFMTAATQGAKPEWYRMPEDVEKVRICTLSGMRVGPRCEEERSMSSSSRSNRSSWLAIHRRNRMSTRISSRSAACRRRPARFTILSHCREPRRNSALAEATADRHSRRGAVPTRRVPTRRA
jgi:membrane carboxypeptidase/penicillin-binding protein